MIERETGKRPRVMTWPYGAYNMLCVQAAEAEGMPITMNLEAGPNTPDVPLYHTRRVMRYFPDRVRELKDDLRQQSQYAGEEQPLTRVVAVDLDSIYDTDPVRQGKNLDDLIERIYRLRIDTVYLRIVSDADHDGDAEAAYFPNRHLPLRADLFNRVSFQLRTRASVPFVYAWLPVLAFDLPSGHPATRPTARHLYQLPVMEEPRLSDCHRSRQSRAKPSKKFMRMRRKMPLHRPAAFSSTMIWGMAGLTPII